MKRLAVFVMAVVTASCSAILGIDDVREGSITPDAPPTQPTCFIAPVLNFVSITDSTTGAAVTVSGDPGQLLYDALAPLDSTAQSVDVIQLDLFDNLGAFSGTTVKPGTYTLNSVEGDYATCGICAIIYADASSNGTTLTYQATYLAYAGSLTINHVDHGSGFDVSMSNVKFHHVTIDFGSPPSSTLVDDGCATEVSTLDMNLTYGTADAGVLLPPGDAGTRDAP